ncbi:MAG: LON peptidase substrate-binding domain-containing protein, partial [Candidatus Rokubacteria bacterium]|nr:LON peptidase substrate-binding domain-containing protein [Candidatus Rokubacteria bacterium]
MTAESTLMLPDLLSILPLRDTVLFPQAVLPLAVARVPSLRLVDDAVGGSRLIGVVTQRDPAVEEPGPEDLYPVGTAALIHKVLKQPDGTLRLVVQGIARFRVLEIVQREPFLRARVEEVDPGRLSDVIAASLPTLGSAAKQELLETADVKLRLQKLVAALAKETEVLELGSKIQSQVQSEMSKNQREYYLREQMKAIQKELGEGDERSQEIEELRGKIEAAGMSEEARKEALRELDRLAKMPPAAAECTVTRTYLDWLIALPWQKETADQLDIARAREILDEDHWGLEKVKDRIVEYLAVKK